MRYTQITGVEDLFSFPDFPRQRPCNSFEELQDYVHAYVDRFSLRQHIVFLCELASARADESDGRWTLTCRDLLNPGHVQVLQCDFLIITSGAVPVMPQPPVRQPSAHSSPVPHLMRGRSAKGTHHARAPS